MPRGSWWMKQKTHLLRQVSISPGRGASSSSPRSGPVRLSNALSRRPPRSTERRRRSWPAWKWKSMTSRSALPLMARIRSPGQSPARAAGVRGRTAATTTPVVWLAQAVMLEALDRVRGVVGRIELLQTQDEVLQSRRDGEECGGPGCGLRQEHERLEVVGEHGADHGGHLEHGGRLAEPARARVHGAPGHVDHDDADAQDEVAAHHDGRDP